jgi:hypothetical protein
MDRTGRWLFAKRAFMKCDDFDGGLAWVCEDQRCGYIRENGEFIWSVRP